MAKRDKANYLIQSVSHAIDVLMELCKARGEVGVTELAKKLKLHKNNVFRLLATLELRGLVEQNADSEDYRLGVCALFLGQSYMLQSTLVERATPVLKKLVEELGETVSFATLQNGLVQFPLSLDSKRPVKVAPRVAAAFSAKTVPVGRLLTAQLPDSVLAELLAGNSPQDAAIRNQLSELRNSGQIIDKGASESDVVSVSVLVRGINDITIGAIEVLVPQYRARVEEILPVVQEAASKLSKSLGAGVVGKSTQLSGAIVKDVTEKARL